MLKDTMRQSPKVHIALPGAAECYVLLVRGEESNYLILL
jgi:hypothetical protein